ncbi:MAG: AzlC family ABC transporter permease [Synergistaceae bacterium]|nr:AzlC family ABC transporter permease [Synergistaceae bacterium]MBQ6665243.1 AzlC family ABC transporter permease [Synergistaceae bacterium]MBQ6980962.1 AzlC family ABC transporter permease [Synergistaceae bacterium]
MRAGSLNIRRAIHDTIPVMTGYVVLGIGFGILLSTKGYGALWAFATGIMIYSGTMQFVCIDMFTGGTGLLSAAGTALMVSARHVFYGISMSERWRNIHGLKKAYMIYALTDETYSLVCESDDEDYCFWVSLLDQSYWVTGGVIGALLGEVLPFDTRGIDFALTALFVSICVEQWLNAENHYPAIIGLTSSVLCLMIFGAGNFLIPAMIAITVMLFVMRGRIDV